MVITIKNIESSRREFGKRVKERREELNMSMDELAKLMGYSHRSSIQKIESGENSIPQDKVELLANCLKTTLQHLMGWSGDVSAKEVAEYFYQQTETYLDNILPTDDDFRLVALYRKASDRDKKLIQSILVAYEEGEK